MMKTIKQVTLLCILFVFSQGVFGQKDTHYWTNQYGAKGLLLNGAVIASTEDETAIFYNPGAMGFGENLGLSVSFLTPTYSRIQTTNLLGDSTSFEDTGAGLSPGFLAVGFQPFKTDKITMGATTFTRFKSDLKFNDRVVNNLSSILDLLYAADLDFKRKLSEYWFGFGMAYRANDKFSVGFTQFLVWHQEKVSLDFKKEIIDKNDPEYLLIGWRSKFQYGIAARGGFLTKFGISWQPGNAKFGLTLTTPSYAFLLKDADYLIDDQRTFSQDSSFVISNRRDVDLENFKTPLSIGLGVDFQVGDTRISMAAEYFSQIEEYTLIEDKDDPYDGIAHVDLGTEVAVSSGVDQVFNVALGIQKYLSEKITFLGGFRTDFNQKTSLKINEGVEFLSSTPNVFHVSAGGLFNFGKSQFSVGFDYGFGSKSGGRQLTDFSNITLDNLFTFGGKDNVTSKFQSFTIFLTYDFLIRRLNSPNHRE